MAELEISIESLPPELWEEIVCDLEVEDIGALRLTCKSLHDILWPNFLRRFTDRKVTLFSRDSLQRLVSVADHELFGPRVKAVTILAVFYDTARVDGIVQTGLKRIYDEDAVYYSSCTEDEINEARVHREFLYQRLADQEHIRSEDTHRKLLTEAFQKLSYLATLSFDLIIHNKMEDKAFGNAVEWQSRPKLGKCILETFEIGLSAAMRSRLSLHTLDILGEGSRGGLPTFDLQHTIDRLREHDGLSVLNQVRTFKYSLAQKHISCCALELLSLVNTQKLEDLAIAFAADEVFYRPLISVDRLPSVDFGRLRMFTLDNVAISQKPLLHFLQNNGTLERLNVRNVMLTGTWELILQYCCGVSAKDDLPKGDFENIPHPNLDIIIIPNSGMLHHPNLRTLVLEYIRERPAGSDRHADWIRFLSRDPADVEDCSAKLRLHGEDDLRKGIQYVVLKTKKLTVQGRHSVGLTLIGFRVTYSQVPPSPQLEASAASL
ncbi:hypothetical protein M422DRAFT_774708 [Sphaerobolus stellatus SS14]|nr:hypothetical protein M422DRAFT_774708 [Sphaerobolus stellatus SS14]